MGVAPGVGTAELVGVRVGVAVPPGVLLSGFGVGIVGATVGVEVAGGRVGVAAGGTVAGGTVGHHPEAEAERAGPGLAR